MNNAKIGAAVLGGYVLGRTKKAKLAIGLGTLLAGSRVKPGQLGKTLAQSPFLGNVNEQVRKELLSAGKAAATSVLTAKAEHLADSLHDRTTGMREKAATGGGGEKEKEKEKKAPAARGSGHGASSHARGGATASAHRTSRSGGSGKHEEAHEEQTHEKETHSTARGRSSGGAHRTRRSDDG
ncbi:ABC transporter substrate-binding protein [Streptomyces sp. SCA3-4]|uniref:ABC transporter substrate-binding protein n=1 Tax=Streptomyces sichuanensis TaxID=2871810 RepID=UPI001CE3225C|nr:ABC transporter substrate-binding protein [Streptomyces sichuanensis]MCA6093257.1 ABC transporter substrate-binding protein [Streptomyces sichuanensis]